MKVLVLGLYDDIYVDLDKFNVEHYQRMLETYRKWSDLINDDERIRDFVSLIIVDDNYENEVVDDETIRAILWKSNKRVGELPLSLVL